MPKQRVLTSGRNDLGAYVLPDSFPGAKRTYKGVTFVPDEVNIGHAYTQTLTVAGRNALGAYVLPASFPGSTKTPTGYTFPLDDVNAGKNSTSAWILGGLEVTIGVSAWMLSGVEIFISIPTDTGLLLAGAKGSPKLRYRLYRSNVNGDDLGEIRHVVDATVSLSNFRDHTWELALKLRDAGELDVFVDWVKVVAELADEDTEGGWQTFPLGHYRLLTRKGIQTAIPRSGVWDLTGYSAEALLLRDAAYLGYLVPAESQVLATVRQILIDLGFAAERIVFPAEDVVLPTPTYFDARQNASAVRWLRICNTLLAAGGFVALYTDAEGRFLTEKIQDPAGKPTAVRYDSSLVKERHIIPDTAYEYDDARLANRIVVVSEDVNQTPPIVGVAENHDPNSRVSIEKYGVQQPEAVRYKTLSSQEAADLIAQALLVFATGFDLKLTLDTVPDPRRGPRETYELAWYQDDGTLVFDGKWPVTEWKLPFNLGVMEHAIQRFESFA